MEFSDLNWFDITIITVILLSSIFAFLNGFIKTIFSFITWAGAGVVTVLVYPSAYDYLVNHMDNTKLAMAFASLGVFIAAFIVLAVVDGQMTDALDRYRWGAVDRTLGFAFGFMRGFLMVLLLFFSIQMGITALHMNDEDRPSWVRSFQEASIYPILDASLKTASRLMPQTMQVYVEESIKDAQNAVESVSDISDAGVPGRVLSGKEKLLMKKVVLALPERVTTSLSKMEDESSVSSNEQEMVVLKRMFLAYKDAVKKGTVSAADRLSPLQEEQLDKAFELVEPIEDQSYTDKNLKQLDRLMNTVE